MNFLEKDELERILDDFQTLGFTVSKSDVLSDDVDYKEVRFAFKNEKGNIIYRKLDKLVPRDIYNAYNARVLENEVSDELNLAYANINRIYMDKKYADNVNKDIVEFLNEKLSNTNNNNDSQDNKVDDNNKEDDIKSEDDKKIEKVEKIESADEQADKARGFLNTKNITCIAIAALLTAATLYGAYDYLTIKNKANKEYEELMDDLENNDKTIALLNENKNINDNAMTKIPVQEVNVPATENNSVVTNTTITISTNNQVTNSTQSVVDVHSDEYINNLTEKIYTAILSTGNSDLAVEYNKDLIRALIEYVHHNYPEYNGHNTLSNYDAYDKLYKLIDNKFDISIFFEGLNNYDNFKNLYNSVINIKQEKAVYDDEFNVYKDMYNVFTNLSTNNYPEAVALRAYVDVYSSIPSMQMARDGALEMKDTQDLWIDVNKDGKITYEENAEGEGYNKEKASISVTTKEQCRFIYNKIETDNQNSELSQIINKALDEDDAKAYIR